MSSNPFRRSRVIPPPRTETFDDSQQGTSLDARPVTPPRNPKQKRVQIQTPTHSPETPFLAEDGNRRLSASSGRTNSPPPPPVTVTVEDEESTILTTADPNLLQAQINARRNSAGFDPAPTFAPSQSGTRAPYNPFAKTLATAEAAYTSNLVEGGDAEQEQQRSGGRPVIDVDMFKNILLTGTAPPPIASGKTPTSMLPRSQGSSSGTDVSSLSRHSVFDSAHDHRTESPRPSFDDYESASDDDEAYGNERASLMGPDRPQEIAPPAPPKPKGKGPQTVSFADFDQAIPSTFSSSEPGTSPVDHNVGGILRTSPSRSPSDLNKPLPPRPTARALAPEKGPVSSQRPVSIRTISQDSSTQPKKVPPPPPASRRQAAPPTGRSRSTSNPIAPDADADSNSDNDTSSSSADDAYPKSSIPPPPPPARKSMLFSAPPPSLSSPSPAAPAENSKTMPPPPPPRSSTKPSLGSGNPRSSSDTPRNPSSSSATSATAPPVPPHRRSGGGGQQGSQRSSLDDYSARPASLRRISGIAGVEGKEVGVTGLGISEGEIPSAAGGGLDLNAGEGGHGTADPPSRDLLADLTALQAEVDALRARATEG